MPRLPRLILPGVPLHITQRGVDRCPTFRTNEDFALYCWALRHAQLEARCAVHAYVLMTNHVHLLITPTEACGPVRLMRSLGRRYVRYFNDRHGRTGTLWEGRYRSATVDSVSYFFACSRYIEMNPVRAGIVAEPNDYMWSSFRHNGDGEADTVITAHPRYMELGVDRQTRCANYRAMFAAPLSDHVVATLRASQRARPTVVAPSALGPATDFGRVAIVMEPLHRREDVLATES